MTLNQFVSASDIGLGNLRYTPPLNASNNGLASFTLPGPGRRRHGRGRRRSRATASNLITINVTPVNDPPSGTDKTVIDRAKTWPTRSRLTDFGFSDPSDSPANNLLAVSITTLPPAAR